MMGGNGTGNGTGNGDRYLRRGKLIRLCVREYSMTRSVARSLIEGSDPVLRPVPEELRRKLRNGRKWALWSLEEVRRILG